MAWTDGMWVQFDRLVTGEMTHAREYGAASGPGLLASMGYDDLGRRTRLERGNGTTTTWGFGADGTLSQIHHDLAGTAHDQTYGYASNADGQLASRTGSNDLYAWRGAAMGDTWESVNGRNQATQSGSEALGYDGRGNLTSAGAKWYQYTSENQLHQTPAARFAYDAKGRLGFIASTPTARSSRSPGRAGRAGGRTGRGGVESVSRRNGRFRIDRRERAGPGARSGLSARRDR